MRSGWLSAAFVLIFDWWAKGLVITGLGGIADLRSRKLAWTMVSAGVAAGAAAAITAGPKEAFARSRPSMAGSSFRERDRAYPLRLVPVRPRRRGVCCRNGDRGPGAALAIAGARAR